MADLRTNYMGIELKNPIVVGACSLSRQIDSIKELEAAGAGALVLKSLFEEQVQLENADFEQSLSQYDEMYAEAVNLFPEVSHAGPKEHLFWVGEARKATEMPLIGSLNAVNEDVWVDYAKQLAETGVDGLELNFYSLPLDPKLAGGDIEKSELETFSKVRDAVKLPISVKMHPYYTNVMNMVAEFDRRGANAVVMFNRMFQPDLNINTGEERKRLVLSDARDGLNTLRWTALLNGRVEADLVAGTGILTGQDVIKMVMAGATAVQIASTLYANRPAYIGTMLEQLNGWMDEKGHASLADFRGAASKQNVKDPWAYERGQYIKALLGFD